MRLTPEHVLQAEQGLNCIGDRELVLRNMAIPIIENIAVARDSFDVIDLSGNMITTLGDGFPPFPRLTSLYLGSNRISKITTGISSSLPNLEVLVLTANRLSSIDDLNIEELSRFSRLEVLSIQGNPVAELAEVREKILRHIPTLKVLNFTKVSLAERNAAKLQRSEQSTRTNKRKREYPASKHSKRPRVNSEDASKTFEVGKLGKDDTRDGSPEEVAFRRKRLSPEESNEIKKLIETAKSVDEVVRIQEAIRNGTAVDLLRSLKPSATSKSAMT